MTFVFTYFFLFHFFLGNTYTLCHWVMTSLVRGRAPAREGLGDWVVRRHVNFLAFGRFSIEMGLSVAGNALWAPSSFLENITRRA